MRPRSLAFAVTLAAAAAPAGAQTFWGQDIVPPAEERLSISLGGVVNRFDSSVRVAGQQSNGSDIQLENNNLDRDLSTFEAALTWRFATRHRLDFDYFGGKRNGTRTYDRQIDIGDASYPLGATVSVEAKNQFLSADYRYSILHDPTYEVGLLVGIYNVKVDYDIQAVGTSGSVSGTYSKSVSTNLPLPLLGVSFDWYPDPHLRFGAKLAGIKAKVGDVDGHAYAATVNVDWMLMRGFGIGARYGYFDVKADVDKDDFNGNLGVKTNGVSLYAKFVF